MSRVDISYWTAEQIESYEAMFYELKKIYGDRPLGLTPEQRDIATQLGLMPPLTALVEVTVNGEIHRGLLAICDDDVYRGAIHLQKE